MRCALCNRPLNTAAVFIGIYPVGPKCAQRANLVDKPKGQVRILTARRRVKHDGPQTMDLFEGVVA